ncbi:MBOAT family O-acyltransferase [Photobacterium alginatilyticum]|uniref:MBOAT family O-acyltransferase n=1 Tax=Photobacterium alginatilyticum TaxID=1775171 RepID=UPI0040686DB4
MAITSLSYFIFALFALIGCAALQRQNEHKKSFLLIISCYFYMTFDWRFSALLLLLTGINYLAGHIIIHHQQKMMKKAALTGAISSSLLILFYFKYSNFFIESLYDFLQLFGMSGRSPFVDVILPIGISFMTFQAITYPLDLYQQRLAKPSSLKDFALFMAFFPQLLSGPIVRASYFMPQLESSKKLSGQDMMEGLTLIIRGLIKKIMIADILALHIVDPAFDNPSGFSSLFLVIALFAYSFQVYMDLSGYTDIAIGVAKMMGFKLPINFNRPYMATSVANFWQRWHITMSSFFRDYLYEAIKNWRWSNIYFNLLVVFVAIGIWHGAGWNFVIYGLIHGSLVGIEHYRNRMREQQNLPPVVFRGMSLVIRILQIFTIITLTRLLFRADDLEASWHYLQTIVSTTSTGMPIAPVAGVALLLAALLHFTPIRWRDQLMKSAVRIPEYGYAAVTVAFIYLMAALGSDQAAFIYFQF